jgi:hypothetical protein
MGLPYYVYVASSWRNPMQEAVCQVLKAAGIPHYDFKNPEGGTGFSWAEVKPPGASDSIPICEHCGRDIYFGTYLQHGSYDPDFDPTIDPEVWRHTANGYVACLAPGSRTLRSAAPKKGSDHERKIDYLEMVNHPRAIEGYNSDFAAMTKADTFVMVLPCGKSAHLELGWAVGAGKRTAILMEDPIEPELMYRMVDYLAPSVIDLLGWLGVED